MGPHSSPKDTSRMPDEYWKQLVTYSQGIKKDHPVLGDYAMLQRINLIHLQNDLADIKADIAQHQTTTECQMLRLRRITHEYADAIRDFEYMDQLALVPDADRLDNHTFLPYAFPDLGKRQSYPFDTSYRTLNREITLKGDIVRELLRKHVFRRLSWSLCERKAKKVEYHKGESPKTYFPICRFTCSIHHSWRRRRLAGCADANHVIPYFQDKELNYRICSSRAVCAISQPWVFYRQQGYVNCDGYLCCCIGGVCWNE